MASIVRPLAAASLVLSLSLAGCGASAPSAAPHEEPAHVEPVEGSEGLHRITLTDRAAERLGIELTEVGRGRDGLEIPYSAIIYDAEGGAWAYVVVEDPFVFERAAVTVDDVVPDASGGTAILSAGPAAGTRVVRVGVAELFGTEFEVGH